MKTSKIILGLVLAALVMFGCAEFEDPNLDFSNNSPAYVELSSGSDLEGAAGADVEVRVRMRESISADVNVSYEVSGDVSTSGTVTLAKGNIANAIILSIPADVMTGTATVRLTSVDNGLSLGRGGPDAGFSPLSRNVVW